MPKKQKRILGSKALARHRNRRTLPKYRSLQMSFLALMALVGGMTGALHNIPSGQVSVLAYATNISHAGLLSSTNAARNSGGFGSLTLNSQLNNAAQAKANDMVAKDYWAHTSPDGREPWDFILAAGYSYQSAGENLAYGALTSQQTVDAWMNSAGHRANIMTNKYSQVGFGILNATNFQSSGNQTVVVAMYASPYAVAPAPAPAATQPAPSAAPAPAPTPSPSPAPVEATTNQAEPKKSSPKKETPKQPADEEDVVEEPEQVNSTVPEAEPVQSDSVRRIEAFSGIYSPWMVGATLIAGTGAGGTFLYHHSRRWHRWIIRGERFLLHHIALDIAVLVFAITAIMMLQMVGFIL